MGSQRRVATIKARALDVAGRQRADSAMLRLDQNGSARPSLSAPGLFLFLSDTRLIDRLRLPRSRARCAIAHALLATVLGRGATLGLQHGPPRLARPRNGGERAPQAGSVWLPL